MTRKKGFTPAAYMRHTMGQDWGGRPPMNPEGAPKIKKQQVINAARDLGPGYDAEREPGNYSYWWLRKDKKRLRGLGMTNYMAINILARMKESGYIDDFSNPPIPI